MTPAEHIRALWYAANIGYNTGTYDSADMEIIEKFAKMVASDCMSVVREYGIHGTELITDDISQDYGID